MAFNEIKDLLEAASYVVGMLVAVSGWVLYWKERKSRLKPVVSYPATGAHGPNILASTVSRARVGVRSSVAATLKEGAELKIVLVGEPYEGDPMGSGAMGAWFLPAFPPPRSWHVNAYDEADRGVTPPQQVFEGKVGLNDMFIEFSRPGRITVAAYENGSSRAAWQRNVSVDPAPAP